MRPSTANRSSSNGAEGEFEQFELLAMFVHCRIIDPPRRRALRGTFARQTGQTGEPTFSTLYECGMGEFPRDDVF